MILVNENILKIIQQTSIAILVLGVLVWVLHTGLGQMNRDREIREAQQLRMADIITGSLEEARTDRRNLTITIRELADKIIEQQEYDLKVLNLLEASLGETRELRIQVLGRLDSWMDLSEEQTRTLTRSIKQKYVPKK